MALTKPWDPTLSGVVKSTSGVLSTAVATDITGQLITNFVSGGGAVAATDTILQAVNKLDGNVGTKQATLVSGTNIKPVSGKTLLGTADINATVALGNIAAATVTFNYASGNTQTYTATGATVTWAFSNWPTTGIQAEMLIIGTNMGAFAHSITGVTWILPTGATTTTTSTYLAGNAPRTAFQAAGVDQILLWTNNGGTTIYGKLV